MRSAIPARLVLAVVWFVLTWPILATPVLPAINTNNIIVVTNAVGDGVTTNTTAIQAAINAAALGGNTNGLSGGTVEIPAAAGTYLSGPLTMASYVNLQIDSGAELQMLPYGAYPGGSDPPSFISASKLSNIEISGSGKIDGQGAPWWAAYNASNIARPRALFAPVACHAVLLRDVALQNPPNTHVSFLSSDGVPCGNVTVTNITINTPDGSPNTDGMDMSVTNALVVNSYISDGDDHIAIGDSAAFNGSILVTNCAFGTGHGVSIGSYTTAGVSNLLVVNCAWNGSENGIRLKSERGRGGLGQSLHYQNLSMANVQWPILIYSYYNYGVGTLEDATPYMAATDIVQTVTSSTPIWRNITFSNVTATAADGRPPIMIWGLPEMLVSNVTLDAVNISGGTTDSEIYLASGVQIIDSQIPVSAGKYTCELYNAQLTITNSAPTNSSVTMSGLTTNGFGNTLAFYNTQASLQDPNALQDGPCSLGGATLMVSNNVTMSPSNLVNYVLGTNAATVVVKGSVTLGGTINISAGGGFNYGTYTLITCTGLLTGALPILGATPAGSICALATNSSRQVTLTVTPPSLAPTDLNFQWNGNQVQLSWPPDHLGWMLQTQTNNLGLNWFDWPDTTNVLQTNIVINPANGAVFFRLIYP